MKRLIAILLALATLSVCAVSLAEGAAAAAPAEETTAAAQEQQTSAAAKTPGRRAHTKGSEKTEKKSPIDFDEMVSKGVISQETCDRIKAALAAQKPAGKTEKAAEETVEESTEASAEKTETKTEKTKTKIQKQTKGKTGTQTTDQTTTKTAKTKTAPWERLLAKLLKADVITQAEYDALAAAMNP